MTNLLRSSHHHSHWPNRCFLLRAELLSSRIDRLNISRHVEFRFCSRGALLDVQYQVDFRVDAALLTQYQPGSSLFCLVLLVGSRQTPVNTLVAAYERHPLKNISLVFDRLAPARAMAFGTWCGQFSSLPVNTVT